MIDGGHKAHKRRRMKIDYKIINKWLLNVTRGTYRKYLYSQWSGKGDYIVESERERSKFENNEGDIMYIHKNGAGEERGGYQFSKKREYGKELRGDEHKKLKIISKHSHRWADVGSDVEAQHLVNVIPSKVDL